MIPCERRDAGKRWKRRHLGSKLGWVHMCGERGYFGKKLVREGLHRFRRTGLTCRFGNIIRSAAGKGLDGDAPSALGERAAHDDRHAEPTTAKLAQSRESIHDRHLDVEQDQIGTKILEQAQCGFPVCGSANDLEVGSDANHRTQEIPHDGRIIHNEDARAPI